MMLIGIPIVLVSSAVLSSIFGVIALGLLLGAFSMLKKRRLIQNLPTSKTKGVCIGLTEVKGTAEAEPPLISFLAEKEVAYFRYEVEEEVEKTVTDTDSQGNTTENTEWEWKTIEEHASTEPFFVRDDTGHLRIHPKGANVTGIQIYSQKFRSHEAGYFAKCPKDSLFGSKGRRRFTETAIPIGQQIFVLGNAGLREDVAEAEIRAAKTREPFIISVKDEDKIVRNQGIGFWFLFGFGLLLAMVAAYFVDGRPTEGVKASLGTRFPLMQTGALAFLAVFGVAYAVLLYNELVRVRNRARQALSLIDVQLKRRADLIPSLAKVVEAAAGHEQSTHEILAKSRTYAHRVSSDPQALGAESTSGHAMLRRLVAVAEAYPALRADENYRNLFNALRDTEDRIALASTYYNDCVTALKNRLGTFPDIVIAKVSMFHADEKLQVWAKGE